MYINNGICNYLSRVAIISQHQQPDLKHAPPKDIWGSILGQLSQALIYHMVSGYVKKREKKKKKKTRKESLPRKKDYEAKAKGLTQIGLFPTSISASCSALPHSPNNCDSLGFIC